MFICKPHVFSFDAELLTCREYVLPIMKSVGRLLSTTLHISVRFNNSVQLDAAFNLF